MPVSFFPPPNSILFTSRSVRGGELIGNLPLNVAVIIAKYDAGWRHQEYCPYATFYDPDFDDGWPAVSGSKIYCDLQHCLHDGNPSISFVQLNSHWRKLLQNGSLWATACLLLDMDFRNVINPYQLRVLNMAEYALCVRASKNHPFKVSIGCDPRQREYLANGVPLTKNNMELDVDGVVSRLTSLCFDAKVGRLVTAMGVLDAPKLTSIYIGTGASDRYPSIMARLRDSRLFQAPKLERVYCSMEFDGMSGPLVFSAGYNSFTTLDLSGAGEYHEAAVECFLHYCKNLVDFRITVSARDTAHLETFVSGSGIIDGTITTIVADTVVELPLEHLRLTQHINSMANPASPTPFLSMFSFPRLEELVLLHLDAVYPMHISWLSRTPFPFLTYLQFNSEAIDSDSLRTILRGMPALRELVFGTSYLWGVRTSWGGMRTPRPYQDDSFLQALHSAGMEKLEVLKLGGECWFTIRELERLLAKYDGVRYSLRELLVEMWYGPVDGHAVDVVKAGAQRVEFRCAQVSHCNYAATHGEKPNGYGGGSTSVFECEGCGLKHPLTNLENLPLAGRKVQDRMRRYWAGL